MQSVGSVQVNGSRHLLSITSSNELQLSYSVSSRVGLLKGGMNVYAIPSAQVKAREVCVSGKPDYHASLQWLAE
jgi:hypothetical protein